MNFQAALLLLLATAASPIRLAAQDSRDPTVPTIVQLELGDRRLVRGALIGRIGNDVLLAKGPSDTAYVPFSEVIHASRYEGSAPRGWGAVGKGAAVGAGFGLMAGALSLSHSGNAGGETAAGFAVIAGGVLILGGTVIGAVLAVLPEDHWTEFDPVTIAAPAMLVKP